MSISEELDALQARADAATKGPWVEFHENGEPGELEAFNCAPATGAFLIEYGADRDQQQRDSNFIAHAREDVPKLVAALKAVESVHFDAGGSQGYFDDGYSWRDHCCNECGSLGEYGIEYPCPTITAIIGVLNG